MTTAAHAHSPRRRLEGVAAISTALEGRESLQTVLLPRGPLAGPLETLRQRLEAAGVPIWRGSPGDLRRMSADSARPAEAVAALGPGLSGALEEIMGRGGVTWLMHRAAYPSNVGFTIRTAEVAGADAVVVDADGWNHADRSRASHVSMGADRLLPVRYADSERTLQVAHAQGLAIVAIEDVGTRAPHEVDLTGPLLLVVGNERHGIDASVLARCHHVVRIPMAGFVPSYNLQAAVAIIAYERLRQLSPPQPRRGR